jgi:acyl-coenzyme A thioesterase PaaI-like protein
MGTLHGGIYCDLADAAMGFAYAAKLGKGVGSKGEIAGIRRL